MEHQNTLGGKNRNPLNIRYNPKNNWRGQISQNAGLCVFSHEAYGFRAAYKLITSYIGNGYNTIEKIITRWAPPSENDTEAYIKAVLKLSGLGGNENIPRPNRFRNFERLEKTICLIRAMTCVECGIPWKEVDVPAIWRGYDLAYPGRREMYCYPSKRTSYSAVDETEEQDEEEHEPTDEELEDARKPPVWDEYWDWSTSL